MPAKGKHIITVSTEHKAVLDTVKELERQGFEATYLDPQPNGLITVEQFKAALAQGHGGGLGDGRQ
jgi:cysteine desulfurase